MVHLNINSTEMGIGILFELRGLMALLRHKGFKVAICCLPQKQIKYI